MKRVLILGVSGMLGHTLFDTMMQSDDLIVFGTVRNIEEMSKVTPKEYWPNLVGMIQINKSGLLSELIHNRIQPDVVINCVGKIKQQPDGNDPLTCLDINARLPHILFEICRIRKIKLIQISTDCVFHGGLTPYTEDSPPSATDVYGMTKYLGEIRETPGLTLRTSIIGHELKNKLSLLEWFLMQDTPVEGFGNALYTGLPTCVLSEHITNIVLHWDNLYGVYQLSSDPISKYELLKIIAQVYSKSLEINLVEKGIPKILSYKKFQQATGYIPISWDKMIRKMYLQHKDYIRRCACGH